MTRLLLDIGNSRLKWALMHDSERIEGGAAAHDGDPVAAFRQLAERIAQPPASVWSADVTGAASAERLREALRLRWGVPLHAVQVAAELAGLRVAYAEPRRLGVDRWLGMQALWRERRRAFVVASAGTALTFDAVDAHGQHLGGVIAPGLLAMQSAVLGATRFGGAGAAVRFADGLTGRLDDRLTDGFTDALGDDTESCVRQGALHACAGLIERLADRHRAPGGEAFLSGGDAATLAPHLGVSWTLRPALVLDGLLALALESS